MYMHMYACMYICRYISAHAWVCTDKSSLKADTQVEGRRGRAGSPLVLVRSSDVPLGGLIARFDVVATWIQAHADARFCYT